MPPGRCTISHGRVIAEEEMLPKTAPPPVLQTLKSIRISSAKVALSYHHEATRSHLLPQAAKMKNQRKNRIYLFPNKHPNTPGRYRRTNWTMFSEPYPKVKATTLSTLNYRRIKKHSRTMRRIISMTATTKTKICLLRAIHRLRGSVSIN